jgi:WD40 repeat protein
MGGELFIWDWSAGKVPQPLGDRRAGARALRWSHDSTLIAVATRGADGVQLIDEPTGWPIGNVARGPGFAATGIVAFSPDDRLLATCDEGMRRVTLWDVETRQEIWSHGDDSWQVSDLAFSPDGRKLAASSRFPARIQTWDVKTGTALGPGEAGHQAAVHCVTFLPSDRTIATGGDDGTLRFWDIATGRELRRASHQSERGGADESQPWIRALDISPDGRLAATSGQDRRVRIWDTHN